MRKVGHRLVTPADDIAATLIVIRQIGLLAFLTDLIGFAHQGPACTGFMASFKIVLAFGLTGQHDSTTPFNKKSSRLRGMRALYRAPPHQEPAVLRLPSVTIEQDVPGFRLPAM